LKRLLEIITRHKAGTAVGICSVCSAHPLVIEASVDRIRETEVD